MWTYSLSLNYKYGSDAFEWQHINLYKFSYTDTRTDLSRNSGTFRAYFLVSIRHHPTGVILQSCTFFVWYLYTRQQSKMVLHKVLSSNIALENIIASVIYQYIPLSTIEQIFNFIYIKTFQSK